MIVEWTFKKWLANFESVDLPIGDLANDVKRDPRVPDSEQYDILLQYFSAKGSHVAETFKSVWQFYLATR